MINQNIITEKHYFILVELKKWKILPVYSLMVFSNYNSGIKSFRKLLIRLESRSLIKSFINPYSSKKYLFLSDFGDQLIGDKSNHIMHEKKLFHNAMVSEILIDLVQLKYVKGFEISELDDSNNIALSDAVLICQKGKIDFNITLNLVFNCEPKERYLSKIEQLLITNNFSYAVYIFQDAGMLQSYLLEIQNTFGKEAKKKILLCLNQTTLFRKFSSEQCFILGEKDKPSLACLLGGRK